MRSDRSRRATLLLALLGLGLAPAIAYAPIDWLTGNSWLPATSLLVGAGAIAYPYVARRLGGEEWRNLRWLLLFSAGLVLLVLTTGFFGGSTDEPFTTPRYAGLILAGRNPYTTQLLFSYTQCSGPTSSALVACATYSSHSYFVYLPLLPFLELPWVPYAISTTLAWVGVLYLVRGRPWALLAMSSPYPALVAANGYNDLPALLLLTLAFVGLSGWPARVAEWLALGTKQFANLIVAGYYLWKRELARLAVALAVSVLWILWFLLPAPLAVSCTVLLHRDPSCAPTPALDLFTHINYWVWLLWGLALFPLVGTRVAALARRWGRKLLPVS